MDQAVVSARRSACPIPSRQRGVALISVLLVFALVTLVAAEMLSRGYLDLRRTGNQLAARQAHYYTLGAEAWARQVLARDFQDDKAGSPGDDLSELWATELVPFEIDEGELAVKIEDLSGRFNLNNLIDSAGNVDRNQVRAFQELLDTLDLPRALAATLADWLDNNGNPEPGGAEDEFYSATDAGYLPANRAMADISELRLLAGLDAEAYAKLEPYVAALPPGTAVNINTAKDKVLEAIYPMLSGADIGRILAEQQRGGYDSIAEFTAQYPNTAGSVPADVGSAWFEVAVAAVYAGRASRLHTVLQRDGESGELTVISRQQGLRFNNDEEN